MLKIKKFKEKYLEEHRTPINNSYNGAIYEAIFTFLLDREKIKIFSKNEKVDDVPLVKPEFLIKKKKDKFIFLSLKTSLRQRWKQADWESIRFKRVYPQN